MSEQDPEQELPRQELLGAAGGVPGVGPLGPPLPPGLHDDEEQDSQALGAAPGPPRGPTGQNNPAQTSTTSTLPSLFGTSCRLISGNNAIVGEDLSGLTDEIVLPDGAECVVFAQPDLPNGAFPVMEDLRRGNKLCDVTLKVGESNLSRVPSGN